VANNNFYEKFYCLNWRINRQCLSIQALIVKYLVNSIDEFLLKKLVKKDTCISLQKKEIELHRFCDRGEIIYRCSIAYQLAPILELSSQETAQQLVDFLVTSYQKTQLPSGETRETHNTVASCLLPFASESYSSLKIKASSPGWIDFCADRLFLANWLQKLSEFNLPSSLSLTNNLSPCLLPKRVEPFILQYAHVRSCSLLRLGEQTGLIKLQDRQFTQGIWQIEQPFPIPWLDREGNFLLVHFAETKLILELLAAIDALYALGIKGNRELLTGNSALTVLKSASLFKNALSLSEAFLEFWDNCRIYEENTGKKSQLVLARLGLLAAVQLLLKILIEESIGIAALVEL
jgi:hypothetical protein